MTREEYIKQAIEFTGNKDYIKCLIFPTLLKEMAIKFFIENTPNLPPDLINFKIETRRRLIELNETGITK